MRRGTRRDRTRRGVLLALAGALIAGCSARPSADFGPLYAGRAVVASRPPLIVVPGVLGSRLRRVEGGGEVWPGSVAGLVSGRSFGRVAPAGGLSVADSSGASLEPSGLFDRIAGQSFYDDLVRSLESYGGYRCVSPHAVTIATDCVLLDWDWRQDMVEAAGRLGETIAALRRARFDPDLRVDVLAHSAGGLVARYYLSYGTADVLVSGSPPPPSGRGRGVDRLILIGTPNFGAIAAVQDSMFGKRFPLGRVGPEVLASFPGIAELFPHPDYGWMIDADGLPADLDLFDLDTWREHRVGLFDPRVARRLARGIGDSLEADRELAGRIDRFARYLERGERFQRALARPLADADAEIFVFGAGCRQTPARCLVERDGDRIRLSARAELIRQPVGGVDYGSLLLEPGDGTVTKSSLLGVPSLVDGTKGPPAFPVRSAIFVCAPHTGLGSNPTFLDNLLHILLYRDSRGTVVGTNPIEIGTRAGADPVQEEGRT